MTDNDKTGGGSGEGSSEMAPRARNRTVMLTPEITGQVRARLAQDTEGRPALPHPDQYGQPPLGRSADGGNGGFVSPQALRQRGPAGEGLDAARGGRPGGFDTPPGAAPVTQPRASIARTSPLVGFLVSFDVDLNGEVYELRQGRLIVTSEVAGSGNALLIEDQSVSPMHAILRISAGGEIQVLDQLSEFGTRIKRPGVDAEIELSGDKGELEHGDVIRFGSRSFYVCIVPVSA